MTLIDIVGYDIVNYKKPSMFLVFPTCIDFKCEKENKEECQNRHLQDMKKVDISAEKVFEIYQSNELVKAIVCGGLEPFDSEDCLIELIHTLQSNDFSDDLVIYTGYTEDETIVDRNILDVYNKKPCFDLIIKYGRYLKQRRDSIYCKDLGITLASDNQYAVKYKKVVTK